MDPLVSWAQVEVESWLGRPLPKRWQHACGVGERAVIASAMFTHDDAELLVAAAILHDLGYAPALAHSGFHPLDGAHYLTSVDASDRVANLVTHHSCAYREAELRGLANELAVFTDEESPYVTLCGGLT